MGYFSWNPTAFTIGYRPTTIRLGWKPVPSKARVTRDEVSGIRKVRESCLEDSTTLMCSLAFASLATCNKQIQLHQYFVKLLHQFNFLWLQFVCFDFLWTALLCSSEQELQLFHINSHISDSFLLKNKRLFSNFSTFMYLSLRRPSVPRVGCRPFRP